MFINICLLQQCIKDQSYYRVKVFFVCFFTMIGNVLLETITSRYFYYFASISTHPTRKKTANYPGIKLAGPSFELRKRMKKSPSCAHVLHNTLNLVISRLVVSHLQRTAEKCTKTQNARAERLFFLIKTIVLRRCRFRRRCLSSLMRQAVSQAVLFPLY